MCQNSKPKINQVRLKTPFITRTHSQTYMRPTIKINFKIPNLFNICQLFATIGVTIIVALFLPYFNSLLFSLLHYNTELHKMQVRSQLTFPKFPKQNEHQFYKIKSGITECFKKPSQVVSEQILTLYFKRPSFLSYSMLQMSSDVSSVFSTASLRLGACGPCI